MLDPDAPPTEEAEIDGDAIAVLPIAVVSPQLAIATNRLAFTAPPWTTATAPT
jgi:hypothetical protein